jgi:membrane protease YdiL (CAAX protease family)
MLRRIPAARTLDGTMATSTAPADRGSVRGVAAFLLIAFGLAYAIESVFWLDPRHLARPGTGLILAVVMLTPAIAAFIVARFIDRPESFKDFTGLRMGRNWPWYWAFAWLGIPAFWIGSILIGWATGLLPADITHSPTYVMLSANAATLGPSGAKLLPLLANYPHLAPICVGLVNVVLAPVFNGIFTFGEEFGWRGYLTRALLPLGQWKALIFTGTIWGLWHAPIIALGYNYPDHRVAGPLLMVAFCVIIGVIFGWMRLATGSVWPCVIAHATLNAFGSTLAMLGPSGSFDTAVVGLTGYTGWILPVMFIAFLAATKRLPVPDPR